MDFTKTIIALALMASESIANSAFGLRAIDIRGRGIIIVNYRTGERRAKAAM